MPALIVRNIGSAGVCIQLVNDRAWEEICCISVDKAKEGWKQEWHIKINEILGNSDQDTNLGRLRRKERLIRELYCQEYSLLEMEAFIDTRIMGVIYLSG